MAKIGIDFGTTNSLMVAYDKSTNQFTYFHYDDKQTDKPVPISSTVWYYDSKIVVGKEARENINKFSGMPGHHFEKSIKLKLGKIPTINILEEHFEPYQVAKEIINKLYSVAQENNADKSGADINSAIFTVPIKFDGLQREALRKAANESGIEVINFIHEPFAAIIGHFFEKEKEQKDSTVIIQQLKSYNKNVLVFDWGGGTLDITVVQINDGKMIECGTAELTDRAGDKFDEMIANFAWDKFANKHCKQYSKEKLNKMKTEHWDKLLDRAEQCKKILDTSEKTNFLVNIAENLDIEEQVTRKDFENLVEGTLLEACNKINEAIKKAGDINIEEVLLVGGTCKIPLVQDKLHEKMGHKVETSKSGDLLIAQGAAVIAEMGWTPFLLKDIAILLSDDSTYTIFEKNLPLISQPNQDEELICVDQRKGYAKIIIVEVNNNDNKKRDTKAILKVPVLANERFGDEINFRASINKNLIIEINAYSKMELQDESGNPKKDKDKTYNISKSTSIYDLCFGLDFD